MDQNNLIYDWDGSQQPLTVCTSATAQDPFPTSMGSVDQSALQWDSPFQHQYDNQVPVPGMPPGSAPGLINEHGMPTEREIQKLRRQEQNRRSQKEFRLRKEKRIKELQTKLEETEQNFHSLSEEADELRTARDTLEAEIERLVEENRRLRSSMESSPASERAWMPGPEEGGSGSSSNISPQAERSHRGSG
ncbi:MAG: hypothetical protein MMC23_003880 [Stictis urceolatum]|nr:hypothetical protein [Stictis urceolata]